MNTKTHHKNLVVNDTLNEIIAFWKKKNGFATESETIRTMIRYYNTMHQTHDGKN